MDDDGGEARALRRAVKLSRVPGVTMRAAAERMGVTMGALRRGRRADPRGLGHDDLLIAALSKNGEEVEGELGDLRVVASWLDYVNKDGSTAESVAEDLRRLAAAGVLEVSEGRYRLLVPWP
ncbi:MAG: hypothetical protein KC420_16735 [Myxococcales bacterium]|nr:hypothetical protein [Myxococcales bacterium]MCB9568353.1 hypothetical protein [Myxococcales bacterium]MCB9705077.1 hypothetical protein [Myxococcales bacterium]